MDTAPIGIEELTEEEKNAKPIHRFQKGESGNPRGAGKRGESWREIIKEVGEREVPEEFQKYGKTYREAVVVRAYQAILRGNVGVLTQIMRYSEPPEQIVRVDVHNWRTLAEQNSIPESVILERAQQLALAMTQSAMGLPSPRPVAVEGEFKVIDEATEVGSSERKSG